MVTKFVRERTGYAGNTVGVVRRKEKSNEHKASNVRQRINVPKELLNVIRNVFCSRRDCLEPLLKGPRYGVPSLRRVLKI